MLRVFSGMISPFIDAVSEVGVLSTDASDASDASDTSSPLAGTFDWIQRWADVAHESKVTLPPLASISLTAICCISWHNAIYIGVSI